MTRKIIQLCTGEFDNSTLYALCNDGTVFSSMPRDGQFMEWHKLKDIPQD